MSILSLGWEKVSFLEPDTDIKNLYRVTSETKNGYLINNGDIEIYAKISGRLINENRFPVTGDFVQSKNNIIKNILKRKNTLLRGKTGLKSKQKSIPKKQIIASNLDYVFIVSGLDNDYNPRRIERYLNLSYNCGITPVIVLNKIDLHGNLSPFIDEVEKIAPFVDIFPVSANKNIGLQEINNFLTPGNTAAFIGSSGVGKSSIINRLLSDETRKTAQISNTTNKGRHTTTSRNLIVLKSGAMIIDNPGIREIAFTFSDEIDSLAFYDINSLAKGCRFRDCNHESEPGCKVLEAVRSGDLDEKRLNNYKKMKLELTYINEKEFKSHARIEKEKWKDIQKNLKKYKK